MKKIILIFIVMPVFILKAQGCSDAGICAAGNGFDEPKEAEVLENADNLAMPICL